MSSASRRVLCSFAAFLLCLANFQATAWAQEPGPKPVVPVPMPEPPGPPGDLGALAAALKALPSKQPPDLRALAGGLKPLPLEPIPDNPPPHEGAMVQLSYRIAPPDLLLVEVIEALPGRPITGEHLVRTDGTISLGFYGDIDVTGLTVEQAKVKIILHLRNQLSDLTLGLINYDDRGGAPADQLDPFPQNPPDEPMPAPNPRDEKGPKPPEEPKPPKVIPNAGRVSRPNHALLANRRQIRDQKPAEKDRADDKKDPNLREPPVNGGPGEGAFVYVSPKDSVRVFVDVTAYNSKVYYVAGHVGTPGRLPVTGQDTVLDAINYAGGVLGSGDRSQIRLYRPARGGKPAREYAIDLNAVERGDNEQNLQLFPGDRIVVPARAIRH